MTGNSGSATRSTPLGSYSGRGASNSTSAFCIFHAASIPRFDYHISMDAHPPLGYNTYSVRAMRWHDLQLLEYAATSNWTPSTFRIPSIPPTTNPRIGKNSRTRPHASDCGSTAVMRAPFRALPMACPPPCSACAKASGTLLASDRSCALPRRRRPRQPSARSDRKDDGDLYLHAAQRPHEAIDAGVKFAIENHKDLYCWQTRNVSTALARSLSALISTLAIRSSSWKIRFPPWKRSARWR